MKAFDRYFFGPVAAARPWLLTKAFLLLLAFDCWIDLSPHGGRYGIGDFNVAHFAWLDALVPTPTPATYVGLICFCGLLSLTAVVGGMNRWVLGLLAATYTYAWAMSMLDSYQHHYLLTIALVAFALYPMVTARHLLDTGDAEEGTPAPSPPERGEGKGKKGKKKSKRQKARAEKRAREKQATRSEKKSSGSLPGGSLSAWAYHATAVSFGIVYCYTALSKSEPQWRDGTALQRIAPEGMAPFYERFVDGFGWSHETFWSTAGLSVILVQIVIAAGYFCAPLMDRDETPWAKWVCLAGWFGATSFHIGAEHLELQIGWFSYYMLIAAAVMLLPAQVVAFVGRAFAAPAAALVEALTKEGEIPAVPMSLGVALITAVAGYAADMPGAFVAGGTAGVAIVALSVGARAGKLEGRPEPLILGMALAALGMWASFVGTEARYDYYRFVGGDHRRRGELEEALEAYIKANDYAPEDENRREREDEVRRQLGLPPRWSG